MSVLCNPREYSLRPESVEACDASIFSGTGVNDHTVDEGEVPALREVEALVADPVHGRRGKESIIAREPEGRMPEVGGRVEDREPLADAEPCTGVIRPRGRYHVCVPILDSVVTAGEYPVGVAFHVIA